MKKIITNIITTVGTLIAVFWILAGIGMFVSLSTNILEWEESSRELLIASTFVLGFIAIAGIEILKDSHRG